MVWRVLTILALLILAGCAQIVQTGDTAQVNYVGRFTNGTVFDQGTLLVEVGSGQVIAGFDRALVGMREGETKTVTIPASEAYGGFDPDRLARVPKEIAYPRLIEVQRDIVAPIGEVPNATIGALIPSDHFVYNVTGTNGTHATLYIVEVTDGSVQIPGTFWQSALVRETHDALVYEHEVEEGQQVVTPLGPYNVSFNATHLVLRTQFQVGGEVRIPQGVGRVTRMTDDAVYVDFNHPLAGHDLVFEITLTGVIA